MKQASRQILEAYVQAVISGEIDIETFLSEIQEYAQIKLKDGNTDIFAQLIPDHLFLTFFPDAKLLQYICMSEAALKTRYASPPIAEVGTYNSQDLIAKYAPKNCAKAKIMLPYHLQHKHGFCEATLYAAPLEYNTQSKNFGFMPDSFILSTNFITSEAAGRALLLKHAQEVCWGASGVAYFESEAQWLDFLKVARYNSSYPQEVEDEFYRIRTVLKPYEEVCEMRVDTWFHIHTKEWHHGLTVKNAFGASHWKGGLENLQKMYPHI